MPSIKLEPSIMNLSLIPGQSVFDMLVLAVDTPLEGCFVEFGVYRGGSAWHLARLAGEQGRKIHLFDTFTGIPERSEHDVQHYVGDFGDCDVNRVMALIPSAIFHVGVFPKTMTEIGPIAFAHIDCDQYVSCVAAIEQFLPRLLPGGILLFDDYGWTSGVTKAVDEAFTGQIKKTVVGKAYIVKSDISEDSCDSLSLGLP